MLKLQNTDEEIKDVNKCRDGVYLCIRRPKVVNMSILPKLIYRFNTILMKLPAGFHAETNKMILKYI